MIDENEIFDVDRVLRNRGKWVSTESSDRPDVFDVDNELAKRSGLANRLLASKIKKRNFLKMLLSHMLGKE